MSKQILNGVVYGKPRDIRELTQAQYDALSNAEKMNGVLYCIKDSGIVEGDKYAPVIYSLDEREIGTWTDGKPLYEKTFHLSSRYVLNGNTVCVQWIQIPTNILPIGFEIIDFNSATTSFTHQICSIGITSSGWLFIRNNCGTAIGITDFVLRYIKTTDVPGSGSWGTDGVPMVHYDGNEKIIGTWFGETLYEKTWTNVNTVMSISGANWQEISVVNLTGVNYIVSGEFYRISGGVGDVKSNNIAEMGISLNSKLQLSYLSSLYGGTLSKITLRYTKTS